MQHEISLHEFEQFALDRMRVLKAIDAAKARGMKPDEMKELIDKLLVQYIPLRDSNLPELEEDLRKDQVSHYILRMAYSRTEELRRWFLRQEELLFSERLNCRTKCKWNTYSLILNMLNMNERAEHRFNALDADARTQAMRMLQGSSGNGEVALMPITEEEYETNMTELMAVFGGTNMNLDTNDSSKEDQNYFRHYKQPWQHIYKVPFEQVYNTCAAILSHSRTRARALTCHYFLNHKNPYLFWIYKIISHFCRQARSHTTCESI